jgi:integrase
MLTEFGIWAAKPSSEIQRLLDKDGLYMYVTPAGGRLWRQRYRFGGKEQMLGLGRWPNVTLKQAREESEQIHQWVAEGVDPAAKRREKKAGASTRPLTRTFEMAAREWWTERKAKERWDEGYAAQVMRQFERDVFPIYVSRGLPPDERQAHPLLKRPVREWPFDSLMPPDVLELCRNVEARGSLDTARDLRSRLNMVYQREKVLGRCVNNPAEDVTALLAKPQRTNHATITYEELPELFCRLDAEELDATTRLGLEGIIATWLRSTELRLSLWPWLDWDARELRIPSGAMKNGDKGIGDQVVPLSDYALDVFRRLHAVTGHGELMFPSLQNPGEPISDGTWLNALYRMGYKDKATVHGMRALGSTTANDAYVTVPGVPVWRHPLRSLQGHRRTTQLPA